jgi:hypothetical protein
MILATITVSDLVPLIPVFWIVGAFAAAAYGKDKDYPFTPLFLSALMIGWPIVLLAVTIAGACRARY